MPPYPLHLCPNCGRETDAKYYCPSCLRELRKPPMLIPNLMVPFHLEHSDKGRGLN